MNEQNSTASNIEIGNRIKARRLELGLTLKEVANRIGVASSTIQRYENATISQIKLPVLQSIAAALNLDPTSLIKSLPSSKGVTTFTQLTFADSFSNDKKDNNNDDEDFKLYKENYNKDTLKLIKYYLSLNDVGKKEALKRLQELAIIYKK